MRFTFLPLCLLSAAITAGCSSKDHVHQANPFDEPVRVAVRSTAPVVAPVEAEPIGNPALERAPAEQTLPQGDGVEVFAAGDVPYTPVSVPISVDSNAGQVPGTPITSSVEDQVLAEAHRVGALGDVSGQVELLQQAGSMGNAGAYYDLAKIYLTGQGVPKDADLAVSYLNSAMSLGHAESTRVLGWLYVMGSGVPKDIDYGKLLLEKASETSVRAQREYGMALANLRTPHLNDMGRGLELLKTAADAGDEAATKAYQAAFSPAPTSESASDVAPAQASEQPAVQREALAAPRRSAADGGGSLKAQALGGDLASMYQYALNVSLGKITDPDPQFTAYCFYSVASSRGYKLADDEVRSLSGIKTLSDKKSPGRMARCIADLNNSIAGY